jgi:hypothetical protein
MPMSAGNGWLPLWLRLGAVAAFVVVAAVHLWHLRAAAARVRAWHIGHVVMALGMIAMFAPGGMGLVPAAAGETVFAVTAVLALMVAIVRFASRHRDWLWPFTVVDHAAMIYMFALVTPRLGWLTWLFVVWFVVQAAGWLSGWLTPMDYEKPAQAASAIVTDASIDPTTEHASADAARTDTEHARGRGSTATLTTAPVHDPALRATLVTMNLGMAYMLVAMWLSMPPVAPTMPSMPAMPGM